MNHRALCFFCSGPWKPENGTCYQERVLACKGCCDRLKRFVNGTDRKEPRRRQPRVIDRNTRPDCPVAFSTRPSMRGA